MGRFLQQRRDDGIDLADQLLAALNYHPILYVRGVNFCVDEATGANIIAFSSGWGDGCYASYWGYDADGKIACLITDFGVFGPNEEDDDSSN